MNKSPTIKVAPNKTLLNSYFLFYSSLLTMGVWGRYGSPNKTMKIKRNYIWDCIDTNNIKGDKPLTKSKRVKKKKHKKERKLRKYANRIPKKYNVYIKTKYWTKRKNEYFQKYGKQCFVCKSSKYVQLHHLEYKNELFGIEPDEMLVQLCKEHHEEFHALYGVKRKMYQEFDDFIDIKYGEQVLQGI